MVTIALGRHRWPRVPATNVFLIQFDNFNAAIFCATLLFPPPCPIVEQANHCAVDELRPADGRIVGIGPIEPRTPIGLGTYPIDGRHASPGCAIGPDSRSAPNRSDVAQGDAAA